MRDYVVKSGRALRLGYTTGSCATAAATTAAQMLLTGAPVEQTLISLPSGEQVSFSLEDVSLSGQFASCSVIKDAGDDPDVTDGIRIFAECRLEGEEITLRGGKGVGVVMAEGLQLPKGEAAINPVPRRMILENVRAVCKRHNYRGGLSIIISAPEGELAAQKTFNPRLGIVGGISILGTTGIVEPMSERAVIETVKLLIDKSHAADPQNILITPGNYGLAFCRDRLGMDTARAVKYANYLGECLDYIAYKGFRRVLLVGHAGKLFKTAGGIMDTHSRVADCRMEILTAHAALAGADARLARKLMACNTTDAAVDALREAGLAEPVFATLMERTLFYLRERLKGPEIEVIVFSREDILLRSANPDEFLKLFSGAEA